MPPKKPTADSTDMPSSNNAPVEEKKPDAATVRKVATHPSTAVMVKKALEELDSRKGVSSQAIQSYIKQKYPSVDLIRLKHLVRKALKKGIETGTLVRPANSKVTTGATGKFRIAPKVKEAKPTTENLDPNVEKPSKAAKVGAKKPKKASVAKMKDSADEEDEAKEDYNPPKKTKKGKETATAEPTTSKVAPTKKPNARKAAKEDDDDDDGGEGADSPSDSAQTKGAKATKKATKAPRETKEATKAPKEATKAPKEATKAPKEATKAPKEATKAAKATKEASESKAAKASSDAPAAKAIGKRGRPKTAE